MNPSIINNFSAQLNAPENKGLQQALSQNVDKEKTLSKINLYTLEQVFAAEPLDKKWLNILFSIPDQSFILKILGKYNWQIRKAQLQTVCYRYLKKIKQDYLALLFL